MSFCDHAGYECRVGCCGVDGAFAEIVSCDEEGGFESEGGECV